MKYTYYVSLQGLEKTIPYLHINFDRTLSTRYISVGFRRSLFGLEHALIPVLNKIKGVVKCDLDCVGINGGLIAIQGEEITTKLEAMSPQEIPLVVSRIVKAVQRRYAKGETRQRIKYKTLQEYVKTLNAKTYGTE